ncbi:response regulator [Breoghania sp. L-A4]|uniref:response regulator n=1 Tax=Breoghania sp. L-A4 TaxID=2304600 RepID=UPI0013C2F44E|nr:response regulator [Breoghania sp. L-A4]
MIIDDDDDDIYLMKKAICILQKSAELNLELKFINSGSAAVGEIDRGLLAGDLPGTIFLDLNMPGVNGLDVLRHCTANEIIDDVRIIVITTASDSQTHEAALSGGARSVVVKPDSFKGMVELMEGLLVCHCGGGCH